LRTISPDDDEEAENVDNDDAKKLPIDSFNSNPVPHEDAIVNLPDHTPVVTLDQNSVKELCTSAKTKGLTKD
jgi:hypothetical protein